MNYGRVYNEFIADRRLKPAGGLRERHHIVPRNVGGGDEAENLISLSPADHFFAHLLLAKIHGGRLWVPVVLWCGGDKGNWRARKSRRNYDWVARVAASKVGGEAAWQYDFTMHRLVHADGRTVSATQYDLHSVIGGCRSGINLLLKRKIKSYLSWRLESVSVESVGRKGGNRHPLADQGVYTFVHTSGVNFTGTRFDFRKAHGMPNPNICELVNGNRIISRGWSLLGAVLPRVGRAHARSQRQALVYDANDRTSCKV